MNKKSGAKKDGWNLIWSVMLYVVVLLLVALVGIMFVRSGEKTTNPVAEIRQRSAPMGPNNFHTAALAKNLSGRHTFS